jgi:Acyl-CoA reductase (LuxC).
MNLQMRIDLATQLGEYILSGAPEWQDAKHKASLTNPWFTSEFIDLAAGNISSNFLDKGKLQNWVSSYNLKSVEPKKIGIVMAGNIPLVGFHDFLSVFISGHKAIMKTSSKDEILIKHLGDKIIEWNKSLNEFIVFQEMLKNCDVYIATGSNNSARYFEYYFKKYPHIIRRNRTSVAVLDGNETITELEKLADDVHLYFGMGCRNVTKIYVPKRI